MHISLFCIWNCMHRIYIDYVYVMFILLQHWYGVIISVMSWRYTTKWCTTILCSSNGVRRGIRKPSTTRCLVLHLSCSDSVGCWSNLVCICASLLAKCYSIRNIDNPVFVSNKHCVIFHIITFGWIILNFDLIWSLTYLLPMLNQTWFTWGKISVVADAYCYGEQISTRLDSGSHCCEIRMRFSVHWFSRSDHCYVFAFLAFMLRMSFVDLISLFLKLALASDECLINFFSTDNKNFLVL